MFSWVFDVPLWIVGPCLVALLGGTSLAVLAVRPRILPRIRATFEDNDFVGVMVHSIMVFYGLVLALIAVRVFESYSECSRVVSTEASAIAMLYRDAQSYPEPARSEIQTALRDYTHNLINEAWPLQRKGRIPRGGVALMDSIQARLAAFEPTTEGQKALHVETWRAYNHFVDARRTRLENLTTGLPAVMWMVVLLGAAISLSAASFFHVPDARLHAVLVAMLATFIASVIFVVIALDHPFRGDLGIRTEAYELIYDQLMSR